MCKCPNYMIFDGSYSLKTKRSKKLIDDDYSKFAKLPSDYTLNLEFGESIPHLKFIGHQSYENMMKITSPWIQVPCGHCLECRINQTRVWASRCVLEAKQYKYNYFVTLTYDDYHLPNNMSLDYRDVQLFLKRLRARIGHGIKIRFLCSGEYGDKTCRPHYHLILFNCPLNDLTTNFKEMSWKYNEKGDLVQDRLISHQKPNSHNGLKYSKLIHECWHFNGNISVGEFSFDTAAYISQYCTKKVNPKNLENYKKLGIVPEFLHCSTRPGIGASWFDSHPDDEMYAFDHVIIAKSGQSYISAIPRYFDKLFINKYGEDFFQQIRDRRYKKRIRSRVNYINGNRFYDNDASNRDYHLHKIQKLKTQI